ncbi:phosphate signaling complex protein PhoU [Microlunatus sp. Gsoil 973]|uniref:phosphate signaling complex protein PhoU n=1 Tax=Microlunatus sp. Gsoil 973 TaxID=2672569 RepID=UPI0012B4FF91|nr:phosphate signaling complex protein PhoU [Microlunatus sp. Gsoil 973]QGN33743.1 phosphate signaling complex protein PhoU [Microlunatus sp. Gsoil 973]
MRDSYQEELNEVLDDLVSVSNAVSTAVQDATSALLDADIHLAETVISGDSEIDVTCSAVEDHTFSLLALQAPVASELRLMVATLRMIAELERTGDLAAHIAKIARMRYPERAVPEGLRPNFVRMGEVAQQMVTTAGSALKQRDVATARNLLEQDQEMDELRRSQFRTLLGDDWPYGVEAAVDVALLGRYFERIADHAVSLARRIVFVVTGELPDGDVWAEAEQSGSRGWPVADAEH